MRHTHTSLVARVAPMRMIRALFARKKATGTLGLEDEIVLRQVDREEKQVVLAGGEARAIEGTFEEINKKVDAALHDKVTPGEIDPLEAVEIVQDLARGKRVAHAHTERLEALAS